MSKRKILVGTGLVLFCLSLFGVSYKLFEYHRQLQELLAIVQGDEQRNLEQNIAIPSVVEKIVGKSQLWRPVQESARDSVVQIFVQGAEMDMLQPYKTPRQFTAYGSGFFINKEGDIATNAHVVKNAKTIWIQIPSLGKRILDADVVGESPARDLALLKLTDESKELILELLGSVPYLKMGNSDYVRRADEVMALGYPLGMQSLKSTTGIISGREGGLIQISAAINPGNSGGPLLNLEGEVIGINSSKIAASGIDNVGYMIPVNNFRIVLDDLREVKLLRKPFLGLLCNNGTDDLTKFLGNPKPGGCFVTDVIKNSTLYNSGVQSGDMIYEINGISVDIYGEMNVGWSEDKISFVNYISRLSVGQDIHIMLYRNGERMEMDMKFEATELPAVRQVYPWIEEIDYEVFAGMVVMELTANHIRLLVNHAPGLMFYSEMKNQADPVLIVTHVFPTSQLYRTRTLLPGATLNQINGISVNSLEEFRQAHKAGDGKCLTIRATDRYTNASDNILVVLPVEKVLQEEAKLAHLYKYPVSQTAKDLLADYMEKNGIDATVNTALAT